MIFANTSADASANLGTDPGVRPEPTAGRASIPSNAIFGFDDAARGDQAAERLRVELPGVSVSVHANDAIRDHAATRAIDEQVTGGLLSNLSDLFKGIFEWGSSPHAESAALEETVRRGGVAVSVTTADEAERDRVDAAMEASGCSLRTQWLQPAREDNA